MINPSRAKATRIAARGKKPDSKDNKDSKSGDPKNGGKPSDGQPSQSTAIAGSTIIWATFTRSAKPGTTIPRTAQRWSAAGTATAAGQSRRKPGSPATRCRTTAHERGREELGKKPSAKIRPRNRNKPSPSWKRPRPELEEILRQMREEEMKRLLAMLEARFLKILQMQREVNDKTVHISTPWPWPSDRMVSISRPES